MHKRKFTTFVMLSTIFSCIMHADDLKTSVQLTLPYNATNGAAEPFTPMVHYMGQTYMVWVDAQFRPWVTQKGDKTDPVQVPLDNNPDYTAYTDGHHRFSMGIDKYGYLHIAGDMHGYPSGPNNNSYLPERYRNQKVMYWVSNKPYDVTGGFTFAGGANATTAIPGQYFNTVHFFNDNNRELYFTGMVRAYQSWTVRLTGEMAVGLYKYDADKKTWSIIGDYGDYQLPASANADHWKVFYWEKAGVSTQPNGPGWFGNYWPSFMFDHNNNLHFGVTSCVVESYQGPTRLLYAVSKDGGMTWSKANGQKIPGLPLRGVDSAPSCADVVYDTRGNALLGVQSWVVADVEGNPAVTTNNAEWYIDPVWRRWNGTAWTNDISNSRKCMGSTAYLAPDGNVSFFRYNRLRRTPALTAFSSQYNLQDSTGLSEYFCVSDIALKESNAIYCLAKNSGSSTVSVIRASFTNYGLPFGWDHRDIGSTTPMGGDADYYNGVFKLRSSGVGVQNAADTIHFGYRFLRGDGSIVARVASQDTIRPNAVDGIMIRDSLDPNSKCFMIGCRVGGPIVFRYRTSTGGLASISELWDKPGKWLKLTRSGQTLTAYSSSDGNTWTQIGTQNITMTQNVYVGVMGWCSEPLTEIHVATIDKVKVISAGG